MIKVTDWSGVAAAMTLIGTLYAGAISPLSNDVGRQEKAAETLAKAVVEQNKTLDEMRIELARQAVEIESLKLANGRSVCK